MITKNPMQLKSFIKNKANEYNISPQLCMQNYMLERLLERVSLSSYKNKMNLPGSRPGVSYPKRCKCYLNKCICL